MQETLVNTRAQTAFEWTEQTWGRAVRCAPFAQHAVHLFSTRDLALRGSHEDISAAWEQLAHSVDREASTLVRLNQVHGIGVARVTLGQPRSKPDPAPEADAIVTNDPRVALCVQVADCVPLLLVNRRTGAVGAAHAGWRGMARGIVSRVVDVLISTYDGSPDDLVAAVGPSIGPCCYVVGGEVRRAFAETFARDTLNAWFLPPYDTRQGLSRCAARTVAAAPTLERLDLWRAAADQLAAAGVPRGRVHVLGLCTAANLDVFHSYRAEGQGTGRIVGIIGMNP